MLATDALGKNSSIKYVIDLHRDSISESIGKITIDNKDYAKIMIVLGKGHEGYEKNLEMATRITNYLKEFNENITRGIDIKNNSGIYNQDISPNAVLIEVGGPYNDINSVSNSLEVLANVYKRIVDEDNEKEEN
jgi:stage II sporulation protein P